MRGARTRAVAAAVAVTGVLAVGAAASASATPVAAEARRTASRLITVGTSVAAAAKVPFPGKTPAAVLALSVRTMRAASSVHVRLHSKTSVSTTTIDMVVGRSAAHGTVADSRTGTATLIRVSSTVWMGGDLRFWTVSGSKHPAALVGKWVAVTGTDADSKNLRALTTVGYWAGQLGDLKVTERVAGRLVRRVPTVGLKAPDGTAYVATKGSPYPLLLVSGTGGSDTISLYDWNRRVTAKAPAAKLVVRP